MENFVVMSRSSSPLQLTNNVRQYTVHPGYILDICLQGKIDGLQSPLLLDILGRHAIALSPDIRGVVAQTALRYKRPAHS